MFKFSKSIHTISRRDNMTQKELFYVEDAIEHEKSMIAYIEEMLNSYEKEDLIEFTEKELKWHQKQEKDLIKLLEEQENE